MKQTFKTISAICFVIAAWSLVLTALARRDATYAMIDGSRRVAIENLNDAATFGIVAAWAFVFTIAFLILGLAGGKQKSCPACAEQVNYKALKCKHCGSDLAVGCTIS